MTRRYYVPNLPSAGGIVALPEPEAQHAIRVMRVREGDEIQLFAGVGSVSAGVVTQIQRLWCVCDAKTAAQVDREPPVDF